jgi:hypothetical protein
MPMRTVWVTAALFAGAIPAWPSMAQRPPRLELAPVTRIGVLDGPPEAVFGRIVGARIDGRGNVYILDQQANELRVFDKSGAFVARSSGRGQGPGELHIAQAVDLLADGRVAVLDQGNGRISVYAVDKGAAAPMPSFRFREVSVNNLCTLGTDLYLYGYFDGKVLRRLTSSGALVGDFGLSLRSFDHPVANSVTRGPMICVSPANLIVYTNSDRPEVVSVHADGREAWRTTLRGFTEMIVAPVAGGGVRYSAPPGGYYHMIRSAFLVSPGVLAIQIERHEERSRGPIETRFLAVDTGTELGSQAGLPLILSALGDMFVGMADDPFPAITIYRRR